MTSTPEMGLALRSVRQRISLGWNQIGENGSKTCIGLQPGCDLYRAIVELDPWFSIDVVFDVVARRIVALFIGRVQAENGSPYDARVIVLEFNDHPDTRHADVLRVVAPLPQFRPGTRRQPARGLGGGAASIKDEP